MQSCEQANLINDLRKEILKKDNEIARLNIKIASQSTTIDTLHEDIFALFDQRDEDAMRIANNRTEIVRLHDKNHKLKKEIRIMEKAYRDKYHSDLL